LLTSAIRLATYVSIYGLKITYFSTGSFERDAGPRRRGRHENTDGADDARGEPRAIKYRVPECGGMGLLDGVRSLLGRGDADGARAAGSDGNEQAVGQAAIDEAPPGFERTGPDFQSHDRHWDAIGVSRADAIETVRKIGEHEDEVDVVPGDAIDGARVRGYRHPDGPLGAMVVERDGELATAYPVADGVEHAVDLTGLQQFENGLEAWVRASLGSRAVTMFASNFFAQPPAFFGGECRASLAVVVSDLERVDGDGVAAGDGFVESRPVERGASDEYAFRTRVDAVDEVRAGPFDATRFEGALVRQSRRRPVTVAFYVAQQHIDGDALRVGDRIRGTGWLQARIHRGAAEDA
jgi:hypothetical protein